MPALLYYEEKKPHSAKKNEKNLWVRKRAAGRGDSPQMSPCHLGDMCCVIVKQDSSRMERKVLPKSTLNGWLWELLEREGGQSRLFTRLDQNPVITGLLRHTAVGGLLQWKGVRAKWKNPIITLQRSEVMLWSHAVLLDFFNLMLPGVHQLWICFLSTLLHCKVQNTI